MSITAAMDRKNRTFTFTMPLEKLRPSATGKTLLLASTRGCQATDLRHSGRPVVVVANAFIYADQRKPAKGKTRPGSEPGPKEKSRTRPAQEV
jgi:hypothetical protein